MKRLLKFDDWKVNENLTRYTVHYQKFDDLTDEFLKFTKKTLNAKGYNAYKANKSSATIDWTWYAGNQLEKYPPNNAPKFSLSGWHGTGSYGRGKIILSAFAGNTPSHKSSFEQLIEWRFPHDSGDNFANRMMIAYTPDALEDYKKFLASLKEIVEKADTVKYE